MTFAFIGPAYNLVAIKAMLLYAGRLIEDDTDISSFLTFNGYDPGDIYEPDYCIEKCDPVFQKLILANLPESLLKCYPLIMNKTSSFYSGNMPSISFKNGLIYCQEGYVENFKSLSTFHNRLDYLCASWEISEENEENYLSKARGSMTGLWSFAKESNVLYAYSGSRSAGKIVDHPLYFVEVENNSYYISTEVEPLKMVAYLHDIEDEPRVMKLRKNTIIRFEWGIEPVAVKRIRRWQEEVKRPVFRKKKRALN